MNKNKEDLAKILETVLENIETIIESNYSFVPNKKTVTIEANENTLFRKETIDIPLLFGETGRYTMESVPSFISKNEVKEIVNTALKEYESLRKEIEDKIRRRSQEKEELKRYYKGQIFAKLYDINEIFYILGKLHSLKEKIEKGEPEKYCFVEPNILCVSMTVKRRKYKGENAYDTIRRIGANVIYNCIDEKLSPSGGKIVQVITIYKITNKDLLNLLKKYNLDTPKKSKIELEKEFNLRHI